MFDGAAPTGFHAIDQVGRTRFKTPEGYLLCLDVAISRIGTLTYAEHELQGLKGDASGVIYVERLPEEVFDPRSVSSYAGKPVIITHAGGTIGPDNVRNEMVGVVMNPRQGQGLDENILFADLMIYQEDAIAKIEAKTGHQVSAGYNAEYEQLAPGRARQYEIIGNHVALVENGRCGPVCSIGDSAMPIPRRRVQAPPRKPMTTADAIRQAFRTHDEAALENALANDPDGALHLDPDDAMGIPDNNPPQTHNITVNIGGAGTATAAPPVDTNIGQPGTTGLPGDATAPQGAATTSVGAAPAGTPAVPAAPAAPAAAAPAAEAVPAWGQQIMTRLAAIEQALGGNDDDDNDPTQSDDDNDNNQPPPKATKDGLNEDLPGAMMGTLPDALKTDPDKLTTDSAPIKAIFQETIARAELLAPGTKMLTMDGKATVRQTFDSLCAFRRTVLRRATGDEAMTKLIGPLTQGKDFKRMPCDAVTMTFDAAALLVKALNSRTNAVGMMPRRLIDTQVVHSVTPADINAANRKLYPN